MGVLRLLASGLLVPVAAALAYNVALHWDGNRQVIDSNGAAIGVMVILASVLAVSRIAQDDGWERRAVTAILLACAYFMLSWSMYGDAGSSPDASPHLVWFGLCVTAFMPVVMLLPASQLAWSAYRREA